MYTRILQPPKAKSFFLFGPRGTGKTTWVKTTFPKAVYLDLLDAELFNDLLANPTRLENFIPDKTDAWVAIDEVQRIPELLNEVHRLIESHKHKFILTGSSARKLRRGDHNLLAGRALTYTFFPLTAQELGKDFNLSHSLAYGHLPSVYVEHDPKKYLESYVATYLEEEIRQEGLSRNLGAFSRFLEAASFSQGSVLNISAVARECAIERKAAEHYFQILEDLLIGHRIPVFTKRAKRRMAAHPKFYFFDTGIYRTVRPMGPLDLPEEGEGGAFETLVFQELFAVNSLLNLEYQISCWRTSSQMEVDFILYGKRGLIAVEVKRTGKIKQSHLSGVKAFLREYPTAKSYFVYGGKRKMREGRVEVIPISDFLKQLPHLL
jgi:uncharacterized protein